MSEELDENFAPDEPLPEDLHEKREFHVGELLPCPFCGGEAIGEWIFEGQCGSPPSYRVGCRSKCSSIIPEIPMEYYGSPAVEKQYRDGIWNTRTPDTSAVELVRITQEIDGLYGMTCDSYKELADRYTPGLHDAIKRLIKFAKADKWLEGVK